METDRKEAKYSLAFILAMQIVLWAVIILDIPFARQIIGFGYLAFAPGFMLLKMMKPSKMDFWEIVMFSVGLSIALLMFVGLLVNEIAPFFNIPEPLSLVPLAVAMGGMVLSISFLANFSGVGFRGEKLKSHASFAPFVALPFLSIIGALLSNANPSNNMVYLLMIISTAVLVITSALSRKLVPPRTYPFALLMISLALLLHVSLISNYVWGLDISLEYYLFRTTKDSSLWSSLVDWYPPMVRQLGVDKENAMLSVTIFPAIFSAILNLEEEWVMKIVYPIIFSFVPVCLYQLYRRKIGGKSAFLSVFFFMSFEAFFVEMQTLCRQMIAELFYILLFFTLLDERLGDRDRSICFAIFGAGLVLSHYSMSYLFAIFILFVWLSSGLLKKIRKIRQDKRRLVSINLILIYLVMLFAWYIYISNSGAFDIAVEDVDRVYRRTSTEFFNPESRGRTVLRGLGLEEAPSLLKLIGRGVAYTTQAFIVIGFASIILIKDRKRIFDDELKILISLNAALLAMCIILPGFAGTLNMTRFYHVLLFFLAPLCVLGGESVFHLAAGLRKSRIASCSILVVIISFFLFQTEFVYEIANDESWSIPLSRYRMEAPQYSSFGLRDEQDIFCAEWLSGRMPTTPDVRVYGDYASLSFSLLDSIDRSVVNDFSIEFLSNTSRITDGGIVYLRRVNVIGQVVIWKGVRSISDFRPLLDQTDKIYSNGGSELYMGS